MNMRESKNFLKSSKALCIIPARGGSKRIPGKNVKKFLGKPIMGYSIEIALKSGLFDEVMVSTDDEQLKKIAIEYGASVPFMRSLKNSDDYATTVDVIVEVIDKYKDMSHKFDYACCLYPTSPLTTVEHLIEGMEMLINDNRKSVFPVTKFNYPIWRGLSFNERNDIEMLWPENLMKRSQDLSEVYHDAGQWYWFQIDEIVKSRSLFTDKSAAIKLPEILVQDIDTESDWKMAELKYKIMINEI